MNKKLLFILSLLIAFTINSRFSAQTTLQTVDFESAGSGYTIIGEASPYWLRTDGTVITPDNAFTNKQGTYYFYGENTDGASGNSQIPVYVTLNSIDVSLYTDFSIKLLVAGKNIATAAYEGGEYLRIQYAFNGNAFTTLSQFIPKQVDITYLTEDANADGTTDGANLSPTFTEFTYSIPGTGTSLQIRIMCNVDQGSEEVGFDNIRVISGGLLPVELTSFTGSSTNNNVELSWQTATEVNNYGFEIERSQNNNWEKVGFVEGHGNSNSPKDYSFSDKPTNGSDFKYRLKQIDFNGNFEFSPEIEVSLIVPQFSVKQNYPNPFNPSTKIEFSIPKSGNVKLSIFNAIGQEVAVLINENMEAGNHNFQFSSDNYQFSSGIYFYKVISGKYSETKKMILLR